MKGNKSFYTANLSTMLPVLWVCLIKLYFFDLMYTWDGHYEQRNIKYIDVSQFSFFHKYGYEGLAK